jgi:hypothetical protein
MLPPVNDPARRIAPRAARRTVGIAAAAVAVVVVLVGTLLLLPTLIRRRAVARAKEAGLALTIDGAGIGLGGITLRGLHARAIHVPGVQASVRELHVDLGGDDVRLRGLELTLEGSRSELEIGLATLVAEQRRQLGATPKSRRRVSIPDARLSWTGLLGEGTTLQAGGIGVEIDSGGPESEDVHGSVARFDLRTRGTTFGPWGCAFDSGRATTRIRLLFDPPVPDGPSALWVATAESRPELAIRIPRSRFAALGLRPSELGLPADDATELELLADGRTGGPRTEITAKGALYAARPKGFARPVDIHLEGAATAPPDKPFELEKTSVRVGPFVAAVNGTIALHARGARVDALFRTAPVPCGELARAEAQNMGPLAATLEALGTSTGALRVTGVVNASGVVKYDTAAPDEASVEWLAKETCGVSIFGM